MLVSLPLGETRENLSRMGIQEHHRVSARAARDDRRREAGPARRAGARAAPARHRDTRRAPHVRAPGARLRRRHADRIRAAVRHARCWPGGLLKTYALPEHGFGHADEHVNVVAGPTTAAGCAPTSRSGSRGSATSLPSRHSSPSPPSWPWCCASGGWPRSSSPRSPSRRRPTASPRSLIDRQRPHVHRLDDLPVNASYYSGHTAASVAVYCGDRAPDHARESEAAGCEARRLAGRDRDPAARRAWPGCTAACTTRPTSPPACWSASAADRRADRRPRRPEAARRGAPA